MRKSILTLAIVVAMFFVVILAIPALSVEVAPRISDREIIESLAELKVGQKTLNKRLDDQNRMIDQRFNEQNKSIDQRFESIDQRFESIDQRFDFIQNLILVVIAGIFGLIGYIVWDRKTALRPVEERLIKVEAALNNDLQLSHKEGSKLTRLVHALRELAKTDKKVEAVLRSFSLL